MKILRMGIALVVLVVFFWPSLAQEIDPAWYGTWRLNLEKSKAGGWAKQSRLLFTPQGWVVGTSDFQTIFTGPEGNREYVVPPITTTFNATSQFGLSLLTPDYRFFTEHERNPDAPQQHARVYRNLDSPNMFLIGLEDKFGETEENG